MIEGSINGVLRVSRSAGTGVLEMFKTRLWAIKGHSVQGTVFRTVFVNCAHLWGYM